LRQRLVSWSRHEKIPFERDGRPVKTDIEDAIAKTGMRDMPRTDHEEEEDTTTRAVDLTLMPPKGPGIPAVFISAWKKRFCRTGSSIEDR